MLLRTLSSAPPDHISDILELDVNEEVHPKKMLGWREWVALPDLAVAAIKAKVDTGARTSALHAFRVEAFHVRGVRVARFAIHPYQRRSDIEIVCEAPVVDERMVSDSGGHRERRLVIVTQVQVGGEAWPIEMTLTNRDNMGFRMLLGRSALCGRFFVDAEMSYLSRPRPRLRRRTTPKDWNL